MPTLSANIKWTTNLEDLRRELKAGNDQLVVLQSSADRTIRSLGGEGLIRAAHNAAAAIQQLGGASKLTGSEQDRVNSLMERAIAKYQALGQAAPSALKQLADETKRVTGETSSLDDHLKQISSHVAQFSGGKIAQEATQIAKAVEQIGGADKLTAEEQKKVNSVLQESIDKYKALGQTAPKAITDLANATKQQVPLMERLSTTLKDVGQQATQAGSFLTKAITLPLAAMGGTAAKAAIDFETAFAGVRKTVSGTPAELDAINKQFREMAKVTPVTAVELAKIGEMAGQLGVQKDKIAAFTKTIVDISTATNLTTEEAGSAFARLANVLKVPQDEFSNLGSAVVALGNFGASTEQEMLNMAQRIAAAGATAGFTAPQVLGIANALSSVGIEAEAGGTAISRVIIKISEDVASGTGTLGTFAKVAGMSADEFAKAWRDDAGMAFAKFMQGLADARKRGGDELLGLIHELGFDANVRLANSFLSAANAGDLMRKSIELGTKSFKENTELARAAGERYQTTANQLKILWNRVTDVAITLGNAMLPAIKTATHAADEMLPIISGLADQFVQLPGGIQLVAVGMGAIAAAAGPALLVFGQLAKGAEAIIGLFAEDGLATRLLAGDLVTLEGAARGASLSIKLLGEAALGLGAFWAGWEIGKLINQLADLDNAAARTVKNMEDLAAAKAKAAGASNAHDALSAQIADLTSQIHNPNTLDRIGGEAAQALASRLESLRAQYDAINTAIQRVDQAIKNGDTTISHSTAANFTYAEALKYNTEWAQKQIAANKQLSATNEQAAASQTKAGQATTAQGAATQSYVEILKAAQKAAAGLTSANIAEIKAAQEVGVEHKVLLDLVRKLTGGTADAEAVLRVLNGEFKEHKKAVAEADSAHASFQASLRKVTSNIDEAVAHHIPLNQQVKLFGEAASKAAQEADVWGVTVKDDVKAVVDAFDNAKLDEKVAKATAALNKEAAERVKAIFKGQIEDSTKSFDERQKATKDNLKVIEETERETNQIISQSTQATLEGQLAAIKREADARRASLKQRGDNTKEALDAIDRYEEAASHKAVRDWSVDQKALEDNSRATLQHIADRARATYQTMAADPANYSKETIQHFKEIADAAQKAADGVSSSFKASFSQLDKIAGSFESIFSEIAQSTSGAVSEIASTLATITRGWNEAAKAADDYANATTTAGKVVAVGEGVASIASATDPRGKSTAATVGGGAAAGARIGASFGPAGLIVGAGVGALIGWWRSAHAEWKKVAKDIGRDIGLDISQGLAQQIADLDKTIVGGTKEQRRKWAEELSLDSIIAEAGGLSASNIQKYEQQANQLFEPVIRGGKLGADATKELNTLIGEFAAQADKTGGVWDPVFKNLIKQSKDLGLNLDAVNQALDAQVQKLGGGLSKLVGGAFSGVDQRVAQITKDLTPEQAAALHDPTQSAKVLKDLHDSGHGSEANNYRKAIVAYKQLTVGTQGDFDRLSRIALASFNTIVASGHSAFDAVGQLGDSIDQLIAEHDKLGLSGGAAYDQLARLRTLTKDNQALIDSVSGLNDVLTALSNLGGLDADTFKDLETQGVAAFHQMTAAGFTQQEAEQALVPFLQNILDLHDQTGLAIDDETQALIDQAKKDGVLKDKQISTNQILVDGIGALIKAVGGDLPESFKKFAKAGTDAANDVGNAIDKKIPKHVDVGISYNEENQPPTYSTEQPAPPHHYDDGTGYASMGGTVGRGRILPFAMPVMAVQHFAAGGEVKPGFTSKILDFTPKHMDVQPAMVAVGERILTPRQLSATVNAAFTSGANALANAVFADSAMGGSSVPQMATVILQVGNRELARSVINVIPGEARRLGVRVRNR